MTTGTCGLRAHGSPPTKSTTSPSNNSTNNTPNTTSHNSKGSPNWSCNESSLLLPRPWSLPLMFCTWGRVWDGRSLATSHVVGQNSNGFWSLWLFWPLASRELCNGPHPHALYSKAYVLMGGILLGLPTTILHLHLTLEKGREGQWSMTMVGDCKDHMGMET